MKKYILYAGVNGAGKSTLYRTTRYQDMMPRINTDEILREFGYWIELHYVGVDSPEIAKQRIAERVKMGGHGIPDKDVEKRFGESLSNLHKIIGLCDLAALYDNTNEFRRFAIYKSGEIVRLSKNIPDWYIKWREGCH